MDEIKKILDDLSKKIDIVVDFIFQHKMAGDESGTSDDGLQGFCATTSLSGQENRGTVVGNSDLPRGGQSIHSGSPATMSTTNSSSSIVSFECDTIE